MTKTAASAPAQVTTITPYVVVEDIERLIAFAKEAFGAVEDYRRAEESNGGAWCLMRIGDSMLMFTGGTAVKGREKLNALHVYVPDCDAVYRRALEAGGESLQEPGDRPYGERNCGVKDPTGNRWYIATRLAPAPPMKGTMRTVTPFMLAKDALGLIEFLKRAFDAKEEDIYKSPDGKLLHAMLWIGDAGLEFGESEPLPFAFYLQVPDADAVHRQAVASGARSLTVPSDQPWGDRVGGVEDPWGNTWYIASPLKRESR